MPARPCEWRTSNSKAGTGITTKTQRARRFFQGMPRVKPFQNQAYAAQLRFNGAADLHPRKWMNSQQIPKITAKLQWGRGLTSAEIRWRAATCARATGASMGPRTYIRGNNQSRTGSGVNCRRFNGAADLHPRKCYLVALYQHQALPASMGPRTYIRGNFCVWP